MSEPRSGPVVVTGATGFVGKIVVQKLLAAGYAVRAVSRSSRQWPQAVRGVAVRSDASPAERIAALDGAEAVIHLGARVHQMSRAARNDDVAFTRDNVDQSLTWGEAARAAGVGRFILVSSVKAIAEEADAPIGEDGLARPEDAYGRSKLAAERALLGLSGLSVVVLRFPLVYGPGVGGNMRSLLRAVKIGLPLPFSGLDNRRSVLAVDNAATCLIASIGPDLPANIYHVSDDTPLSTPEIVAALATGMGRPARMFPVPSSFWRILGGRGRRLAGSLVLNCERFRSIFPTLPLVPSRMALAKTGQWYAQLS